MKTHQSCLSLPMRVIVLTLACIQIPLGAQAGWQLFNTGNLLQNPAASGSTINPWVSGGSWGSVPWVIANGPDKACAAAPAMNSANASPWFKNKNTFNPNNPPSFRNESLSQTITLSAALRNVVQQNAPRLIYGGDAFAGACGGTATIPWVNVQATYAIDCLAANGNIILHHDTMSAQAVPVWIWNPCWGPKYQTRTKSGYRRTVASIPTQTVSIRFTATMENRVYKCPPGVSGAGLFLNGFDNLFLELAYAAESTTTHTERLQKNASPSPAPGH